MFVKLFSSILDSSIWAEDDATVRVWITMLAMCDRNGMVWASSSGIAARARKTPEETRAALALLSAPDPDSRTLAHEGRRVERVDGGYLVLNYAKYRETRDAEERRLQTVAAVRRHRANKDKRAAAGKPCKPNHDSKPKQRQRQKEKKRESVASPEARPSLSVVEEFWREGALPGSAERFFLHYEARGWPGIVDWTAEARKWAAGERNDRKPEPDSAAEAWGANRPPELDRVE